MNDRYLYRAKRKNWRELPKELWWIEGYYAYFKQNDNHCIYYEVDGFTLVCDIDVSTLCACTGLKDKNGKLIWENDIVSDECGNMAEIIWNDVELQYLVDYEFEPMIPGKWCSVVGNIFDEGSENIGKGTEEN